MAAKNKSNKKVGAVGVIVSLALTLAAAVGALYGVKLYADSLPAPSLMDEAAPVREESVSLYTPGEPVISAAPEPAVAPELQDVTQDAYDYDEILYNEDGLLVAGIVGKRYVGYIAVVDDPLRLRLGKCPYFGENSHGRSVQQMAEQAGAVLAVNGGGFSDVGGAGLGGAPTGNVVYEGKLLMGWYAPTVGMDAEGTLHVGEFNGTACVEMGLQWAVSYGPTLIENGVIREGLDKSQQEPRTAVGQREDGAVVILCVQGRQLQALGVSCRELADIMQGYGCVNAGNLDGGASSDMFFQGEYLNVCNTSGGPRPIPTAILVMPPRTEEGEA